MVNLIVGFPIRRRPSKCMNVVMWNIVVLSVRFLDVVKFTCLTPLSSLISHKLLFPVVSSKLSSLPTLALKSPNKIFVWYLGILSNTHSNSLTRCGFLYFSHFWNAYFS
jgi:hypothetical protein